MQVPFPTSIRRALAPFVYGAMFVVCILIIWLINILWQKTVQPCFNYSYTYEQRFEWKAEMERSPVSEDMRPGFVDEIMQYWDDHPEHIEYWGGCGSGKAAGKPFLLGLWHYGPYVLWTLLVFLSNWVTNLFDRRDKIKALDHFRQSFFFYILTAVSAYAIWRVFVTHQETAPIVYLAGIAGAVMIVSNILYLSIWALLKRYRHTKKVGS